MIREDIFSIYQLAERYEVHPGTVLLWRKKGKLPPGFMDRGRRFWLVEEIEEWESQQ